ncbi:retrovirus-related pol polyprotein from transposon TNT 1-94 [Tanacetum coccineum]
MQSFSPSPIPVEDSDSLMEEIDIFLALDDSIPPGIKNDDYDSEGDVLFLEELLNDDSLSLPEYKSFHVDFYNVPSSPRPPEKPPYDDVYFDIEPDTGVLTTKVVDDISTREFYVHVPNVLPTLPTLYPEFDTLLPFSSENEDKVFNPGILISKKEKSPHPLSHRGFKDCPDYEEVMEFESAQSNTTTKLPILKLAQENGTSVTKMSVPVTAEEKTNKKNDVKDRSLLLMALPNEHQLIFSQYNDAKTMFAAIKTRFGGNEATKKTHKTLLKQQYENFSASSIESLDSIFNRLQKIVSRLAILGVVITQEDLNSNFLTSLPPEWNTHVVVWMNKAEIETMSIDDLYNNFKIVEQKVKKSVGASSGAQNLAFMTAPSTSSTNDVNTAKPAYEVSTVSPNVNTASPQVSTASFSDNAVYAFMVENPNGSNLLQQDLEQIHEDDLEAMDLKWQLSLLSMRAKRYFQRTGKKIFINANDTAGYDKSKVECFNYHKMGYFARECRAPRNKEGQFRYQDNTRKQGNNKDTSSKAMLAIDGVGFDWSDMAEEQVQTNMALMAFSDSELNQTEFIAATYKRGLATIEEQLVTYRKNEVLFSEEVAVLKREVACKDYEINVLKSEFEKVKQEKEGIEFKIEKFDNASKSLDKLLESQITDKSKKGLGYNVVPPPHPLIYNRPKKLDLSYSGLDEFKDPEFKSYGSKDSKLESNIVCDTKSDDSKENSDDSLVKEQVSDDTSSFVESPLNVDKETVFLVDKKIEFVKPKNHEKLVKKSVSFDHVQAHCKYHQMEKMVYGNNYNRVNYNYTTNKTYPIAQRNMVPRAVLMKTGLKPFNTVRAVNTAHPKSTVFSAKPMLCFSKTAQSTVRRPFQSKIVLSNKRFNHKVNIDKAQVVNTVRPKAVKTARPNSAIINAVRVNQANVVKTSAYKPQQDDTGFIDSGCSRHITGNIAYLSDFKEFDGGYVTFGGGAHGGRISGKGILKTDSLDFKDVYFVNELKLNLFSVSQMCDKKNYVFFTDIECLVLYPNFKLPDESQILLKIPRKDNMYSFDMKNIVPKESLTCLVAKATSDESMLWHMRLGHINFKNINKLVKDNLVRGLPTKCFENDRTCVACLKGKQHRASCKPKVLNPVIKPLFMLHMDLFGPTFVSSLMHKKYCLVVTDDYSRFTWVFFLTTKDETSEILKNFIKEIENLVDKKVKIIRSDNGTEFKNKVMDDFSREKVTYHIWAEAVSTACYVQNMVLVVKPHKKTPYEQFKGFKPALSFMRPFGSHVTILNTLDNLGKFDGKSDEGTISNESASTQEEFNAGTSTQKEEISQDCIVMPIWKDASYFDSPSKDVGNGEPKSTADDQKQVEDGPDNENDEKDKYEDDSSPKEVNTVGQHVNTASLKVNTGHFKLNTVDPSVNTASSYDPDSPKDMFKIGASHTLEATHVEFFSDEDEPEVDLGNITNSYTVPTTPNTRIHKDHPIKNVIGDVKSSVQTRRMTKPTSEQGFLSAVFRNKKDERGIVIRNKARLVAQGHRQEEGIDYEEVFAPVARIKAIRLFLAYASFMGFLVYQMFMKSAFLYETIDEEVCVTQPLGFKDPDNPDKVYKVVKALYVLHQAPRAWYETLANYLLGNRFKRGKIDQTLFIRKQKGDILLVQETQKEDGIFISQDKYVAEILKKFNNTDVKSTSTLVDLEKLLVKDRDADDVDVHLYRSMIGSLMYLTASRPDIMFAVCACARFQVTPKTSHLLAVKRIFRYLKGKPTLGLWYSRDSLFELVAYTDSDYAGATQDRKSTTGGCQFFGNRFISWKCKKKSAVAISTTEAKYVAAASCCGQFLTFIHGLCINMDPHEFSHVYLVVSSALVMNRESKTSRHVKRGRDTKIPQSSGPPVKVGDEAVHKELGDRMERAATTASSLEAEQDSEFCDKHNMVAYLEKSEGSKGFHEIIDFLFASHIHYALIASPTIYTSLIEQFWQTAALCIIDDRVLGITATIDRKVKITVSVLKAFPLSLLQKSLSNWLLWGM